MRGQKHSVTEGKTAEDFHRLPELFSPHSFRVIVVTDLLNQNVPLEDVQYLAGHSSRTTTRTYDRRWRKVTRNVVQANSHAYPLQRNSAVILISASHSTIKAADAPGLTVKSNSVGDRYEGRV
ncbi:MAG: tyrosine-type recombinase/integrase [Nitrospiraceae bacterium]|nr:tyrosine-type recombinase/integrase [Nitrospiraceae bacterium]